MNSRGFRARSFASFRSISPRFTRAARLWSRGMLPVCFSMLTWLRSCWTWPVRIRCRTASVANITSTAGTRPSPSALRIRCWEITAVREMESWERTLSPCPAGNESRIRLIDWTTSPVCRVESTRWPVSAAVIAMEIDSVSRISPTRIRSGSCLKASRRARGKETASRPTSTCSTSEVSEKCSYSTGSSMVMA